MTDPVLGKAGGIHHFGYGSVSKKTGNPALGIDDIGPIDLVLLSHHQHQDNFDREGKAFTSKVPTVITTKKAATVLNNAVGLAPWESYALDSEKLPGLRITATPCRHHPRWLPKFFSGSVTGFIIEYDSQSNGAIYITGDTVLFEALDQVAERYKIDTMILHLGSVQFRYLTGFGKFTMDAHDGVKLAEKLKPGQIIPVHTKGWSHFKESDAAAREIFSKSAIAGKTLWLESGKRHQI